VFQEAKFCSPVTLQVKELEDKMEEQNAVLFLKAIVKKSFLFHLFLILL